MLRRLGWTALALLALASAPLSAQAPQKHAALHQLFAEEWERGLRENPENATYNGDNRYNDRWTDYSLAAIARREAGDRAALQRLQAIDRASLSPADQLNYDTFQWLLQQALLRQKYKEYLQPLGHQGGVQTADGIAEAMPFAQPGDYRNWIARIRGLDALVDQTIVLMREGVKQGYVPPKVLMQRVPAQIAAQIVEDPAQSAFYRPFLKMAGTIAEAEQAALRNEAQAAIRETAVPAFRRLQAYFDTDYLPHARDSIAATALPDGAAYYASRAAYYTTTDLTPAQIHAIGLEEVARIRAEMEAIRKQVGFEGDLPAFFAHLRSDPKFFYQTPEQLLEAYRALSKRIDPELVKAFHTIPRQPYGVRPIPDNIAPDTTTAYYQPGAADGSRAGFYYVNLYKPEVRPKWEMMALSLHEAVPGHHFQFARGLELPELPMFRKTAYFVAYGEGWGLYAERLGYDMGLYDDPYDRFGQLTYDMWRAVRLVVDTGMHAMGWSRERAIAYFTANAPKTEQDIVNEIDRYIAWPGQALAYKIGQLKISGLRERSARELGDKFDLRSFNDEVLNTGSVPLEALEKHIDAWILAQKRGG
ncbi:DUF885 domain-containing protein [Pseudoxanthomonas wuyuanensis]|uniref:Uncharacterized conserved protein, DUF885 familyt n=1 Tax=Pseudoxanthomonas wuyuanensis TaxID=1073196 RepID=A0A286CY09_9GAMM|nr:DUF885 domain-containing protein [Pseudoxanthomonas wuyuanensis]KAF1722667.1 DUF885 domain-containing protein [Pseudoxanthomonas wuyuanensis]SOD51278.1 Uncharacterized conserved protein, DUF885 familyt [Pseudoxanthomonas wuyuanensis]